MHRKIVVKNFRTIKAKTIDLTQQERLNLLVRNEGVKDYFRMEEDGLSIFASPKDKAAGKVETKIFFNEVDLFTNLINSLEPDSLYSLLAQKGITKFSDLGINNPKASPQKSEIKTPVSTPLEGIKIAIDPGHVGGGMKLAMMEGKFIKSVNSNGDTVEFNEGNLALLTSKLLASYLEPLGAEVMLTRHHSGETAFGKTFLEWHAQDFHKAVKSELENGNIKNKTAHYFLNKATLSAIYHRFFKGLDFEKRANKINEFNPDLSIVIHFNVDETNYFDRTRSHKIIYPTAENYSMVFVPGSFLTRELVAPRSRLEFLRLIFSDDLDKSLGLGEEIARQFNDHLKVAYVHPKKNLSYIRHTTKETQFEGVFSRNLVLTRLIRGPVCYGEPLCQDNILEIDALSAGEIDLNLLKGPKRVEEVATAYFNGILGYFGIVYQ
ncbi:MAG: N-acetylmuramoyl-L-alanine amidase [Flammeovirgaceae bacterium]|nr:N-acetylmuramoyl-L-alanine amidase [Flammeovirgaceae bacterium]